MNIEAPVYRGMNAAELSAAYNNDAAFPVRPIMKVLKNESPRLRETHQDYSELRYGSRERNTIDFFSCGVSDAPILVYFHGGYWHAGNAKEINALAKGPLAKGFDVAFPGYTLAPEVGISEIIQEARTSAEFLSEKLGVGDNKRLFVSGWSAGGHLAACCLDMPNVSGGLVISGIFDLEPIKLCYLNDKLKLTDEEVSKFSPIRNLPQKAGHLIVVAAANELPELRRQSQEYVKAWQSSGHSGHFTLYGDCDHFSILHKLYDPGGELVNAAQELKTVRPDFLLSSSLGSHPRQ